ncbi:hypothetical protein [Nonomuraea sp. SYSU D8015]|uniref:hypothetical protein n=1 Tax=Nonomuraea sp. SYSU D8015 TaxID=2593644 RepID=UPI001660D347|nr:hypothetical protein [Nonomuraea sp. SYSU D8015]
MAKLKVFINHGAYLPDDWRQAVTGEHRMLPATLLVITTMKKDAVPLLVERGVEEWKAENLAATLRLSRGPRHSNDLEALFKSEVVTPASTGVYLWRQGHRDDVVYRAELGGDLTVIAHFRVDPRRGRQLRGAGYGHRPRPGALMPPTPKVFFNA